MLVSVYTIGVGIIAVILLSIGAYTAMQLLVSHTVEIDQYGTGEVVASFRVMYFAMFFFVIFFGIMDAGVNGMKKFRKQRTMARQEAEELSEKQK